ARDLCYLVTPAASEHPRDLQAQLLDNHAAVIDAVPEAGDVRVIRRVHANQSQLQLDGRQIEPASARLEDGFMVLLRTLNESNEDAAGGVNTANKSSPNDYHNRDKYKLQGRGGSDSVHEQNRTPTPSHKTQQRISTAN